MANTNCFKLKVLAPNRVFYEGEADMIELTTTEGEIGVYKDHIPLTAIVSPGILKISLNGEVKEAAMLEGFLEITGDEVIILSESCEWPHEIDVKRAEEAKIRAERRLSSSDINVNMDRAEIALKKSLIRLNVAGKH
ncbi:MAG: ATP synthase F1 subunit epsilon [Lachnospiraceae bacterium]|nr:ATP synthase F1 subunit epsilon [Lachnospiraceae bacterium]